MRIVLIHGYKSSPTQDFFPWLKHALEREGHDVLVPILPNPEAPEPDLWLHALLEQIGRLDSETILVGHSLGATSLLSVLEAAEVASPPKGAILISPPWFIGAEQFRGFFFTELDFDVLPWKAKLFTVIHALDDAVIPLDHAKKYAELLRATLVTPETGGHFRIESAQVILEEIHKMIVAVVPYAPGESLTDEFTRVR